MGVRDWLQKKSQAKSASNILDGLRPLVAAVRTDVNEATGDAGHFAAQAAALEQGHDPSEADAMAALKAMERWRNRKAKVIEAQKTLYKDVALWSSLPPERSFNEIILPALRSGELVGPSEPSFGPAVVAAFRVCEAAARDRGVNLEAHVSSDVLQMVRDAGDLYK